MGARSSVKQSITAGSPIPEVGVPSLLIDRGKNKKRTFCFLNPYRGKYNLLFYASLGGTEILHSSREA